MNEEGIKVSSDISSYLLVLYSLSNAERLQTGVTSMSFFKLFLISMRAQVEADSHDFRPSGGLPIIKSPAVE